MLISLDMAYLLEPTQAQRKIMAAREQVIISQLVSKGMVKGHGKFDSVVREKLRSVGHKPLDQWVHDSLIPTRTRNEITRSVSQRTARR